MANSHYDSPSVSFYQTIPLVVHDCVPNKYLMGHPNMFFSWLLVVDGWLQKTSSTFDFSHDPPIWIPRTSKLWCLPSYHYNHTTFNRHKCRNPLEISVSSISFISSIPPVKMSRKWPTTIAWTTSSPMAWRTPPSTTCQWTLRSPRPRWARRALARTRCPWRRRTDGHGMWGNHGKHLAK